MPKQYTDEEMKKVISSITNEIFDDAEVCENCKYSELLGEDEYLCECRYNPPVITNIRYIEASEKQIISHGKSENDLARGFFPLVDINSWCGKFEKRDGKFVYRRYS